ncbi:MAG: ribonuclease [Pseudomonadota bacterium]
MNDTDAWLNALFGPDLDDKALYHRALTHGSHGSDTYERLEFLGDRVLGLTIAHWLYERFPEDPEGKLSRRLNALVSGETCAEVARQIGIAPHMRLGKQARDDGAFNSDNILGDVIEALLGALYLDRGSAAAAAFIKAHWADLLDGQCTVPRHPKSSLQEWAAARTLKPPRYELVTRDGPHHAPRFTVLASLGKAGQAEGEGRSKQEAETNAAKALLMILDS